MVKEMVVLHSTGTWNLVTLQKSFVGCHWAYNIEIGLDDRVNHLKAHLVAKGVYSDIRLLLL